MELLLVEVDSKKATVVSLLASILETRWNASLGGTT